MTDFQVNMRKENETLPEEKQKSSLWESSASSMLNKRCNSISNSKTNEEAHIVCDLVIYASP